MDNFIINKIVLIFVSFLFSIFLTSCVSTKKTAEIFSSDNVSVQTDAVYINTLIVSYKSNTTSQDIESFEKKLPKNIKKSLGSRIIFSYGFSSEEQFNKAKDAFNSSIIVNNISQDQVLKMEPGY